MSAETAAILMTRAVALLAAAALTLIPLMIAGKVGVLNIVLAAPFVIAAIAPRTFGPAIGKGLAVLATMIAAYDPPSSMGFHPERLAYAVPLFAVALFLGVPLISELLARALIGDATPSSD